MAQATSKGANGPKGLSANDQIQRFAAPSRPLSPLPEHALFNDKTRCFVYGLQPRAVQGMLDFDFICKRKTPSVAGIIYTFGGQFVSKMYWGTSETLLPVYQQVEKAMSKHPEVDVVVNFASSRSVYSSTMELMENPQVKTIAIIAEGVPERVSSPDPVGSMVLASIRKQEANKMKQPSHQIFNWRVALC
jgi:ATP citrate (pro-S)-lyase